MKHCRSIKSISLGFILSLAFMGTAYSHGGGLDANGCHHDRKNGGYHCHRAPSVTPSDSGKSSFIDPNQTVTQNATPQPPPTFVGPRGGVYHYSASGRKVYERR